MDPIRQTLTWGVGDDEFTLAGAGDRWTLTATDAELVLAPAALTALADAIARVGLAPTAPAAPIRAAKRARAGKAWTDEEDRTLEEEHHAGIARRSIAQSHGRSLGAITARLVKLGLEAPSAAPLPSGRLQRALAEAP